MPDKRISHEGVITDLKGDTVTVSLSSNTDCTGCHAKGTCTLSGGEEEKMLHIPVPNPDFSIGDKVRVILDRSLGFRALLLGYVMPFLLVLAVLLALTVAGSREWVAGLTSLAVLIPYYAGLKLMRGKVEKQFSFHIQKT